METNIQTTVNNKKLSHPTHFDHPFQKLPTVDPPNSYRFKQFNWQSSHRLHNRTETHSLEMIEREKKHKLRQFHRGLDWAVQHTMQPHAQLPRLGDHSHKFLLWFGRETKQTTRWTLTNHSLTSFTSASIHVDCICWQRHIKADFKA